MIFCSLADTDSVHRRQSNTPIITHRRLTAGSIVKPDSINDVGPNEEVTLKRHLGLFSGICFIVGMIIGKNKCIFILIEYYSCFIDRFGYICFTKRCST
jgi:hypothetical protein